MFMLIYEWMMLMLMQCKCKSARLTPRVLQLCPCWLHSSRHGEEEEDDTPIILGRPFLNTTNAIIYVGSRQVYFQFPREKVRCYFNSYTTYEQLKKFRSKRRCRSSRNQKNQSLKKSWEEGEEPKEVVKDESASPKSSPQTKQVWKKKVATSNSI